MRDKGTQEASLQVAAMIEAAGVVPADPILKSPRATLTATAGAVTEAREVGDSLVFRVIVAHTIAFTKEVEVVVNGEDKVTYKEV